MLPNSLEWLILGAVIALLAMASWKNKAVVTDSKPRWLFAMLIAFGGAWNAGRDFYANGDSSSGVMLFIFALCLCVSAWGLIRPRLTQPRSGDSA